jgi:hypothetical protein
MLLHNVSRQEEKMSAANIDAHVDAQAEPRTCIDEPLDVIIAWQFGPASFSHSPMWHILHVVD